MGACLSCLSPRKESYEAERSRLLYDDPFNQPSHNYGSWNQPPPAPQNLMSPEEVRREQQALDNITRWASDQIVEIFPHQHRNMAASTSQFIGLSENGINSSAHQDILLSMIPGDRSKKSIRIYPASRPTSKDAQSIHSKPSNSKLNGSLRSNRSISPAVFVKLDVDLP